VEAKLMLSQRLEAARDKVKNEDFSHKYKRDSDNVEIDIDCNDDDWNVGSDAKCLPIKKIVGFHSYVYFNHSTLILLNFPHGPGWRLEITTYPLKFIAAPPRLRSLHSKHFYVRDSMITSSGISKADNDKFLAALKDGYNLDKFIRVTEDGKKIFFNYDNLTLFIDCGISHAKRLAFKRDPSIQLDFDQPRFQNLTYKPAPPKVQATGKEIDKLKKPQTRLAAYNLATY
jgi:hypothetical protein